ncbi:cytochrome b5 domain-containing protein [Fundicoccus culcitae]|uniref:Cytochrome B5 n=1 Tax=Fundicoccus culcitae TaxID=2969821 RepID=A0ABY5PA07_9LACT|nr:cytochrome b5 domain-containing protein [Fundicoccus culcitae]UUX35440.1 cytochrome B5 [Fundicoccus culcitae]
MLATLKVVGRHVDYVFSAEELATFNGQDGNPAYIAVDGTVYDVTNFAAWEGGEHQGKVTAGTDATDIFNDESPHDTAFLEALPVAGKFE